MKKNLPFIGIIASVIFIVVDFIMFEKNDHGFWVSILSSVLIIISMVLTIRANKKLIPFLINKQNMNKAYKAKRVKKQCCC